jgi:hypothetical protein
MGAFLVSAPVAIWGNPVERVDHVLRYEVLQKGRLARD